MLTAARNDITNTQTYVGCLYTSSFALKCVSNDRCSLQCGRTPPVQVIIVSLGPIVEGQQTMSGSNQDKKGFK